jgi:RecA-family ATPase
VSAEDDREECHRRAAEICEAEGLQIADALTAHIVDLTDHEAALSVESKPNLLTHTALFKRLAASCAEIEPLVLILDNLAKVFAGNENSRTLAQQFISALRALAIKHDMTVVLLSHPSLSGISLGTGMSGSTAWSNSVRSRLYLTKPASKEAEDNSRERILEVKKSNYAAPGQNINLKWLNGRFMRSTPKSAMDRITPADAERVVEAFRKHQYRVDAQSNEWGGFKVAELLGWEVGRGIRAAKDRSLEQNNNRRDISSYLSVWVKNRALFIVIGKSAHRDPATFYTAHEPKEESENDQHRQPVEASPHL